MDAPSKTKLNENFYFFNITARLCFAPQDDITNANVYLKFQVPVEVRVADQSNHEVKHRHEGREIFLNCPGDVSHTEERGFERFSFILLLQHLVQNAEYFRAILNELLSDASGESRERVYFIAVHFVILPHDSYNEFVNFVKVQILNHFTIHFN